MTGALKWMTLWVGLFGVLSFASADKWFEQAGKAYADGNYEQALKAYEKSAETSPQSAVVYYNIGNTYYRLGQLAEAQNSFEYAASLSENSHLISLCHYNLGNCLMKIAESAQSENPRLAMAVCQQASSYFRAALRNQADLEDAIYNLEVSLRTITVMEEEIKKQAEEKKEKSALLKRIREKLTEFIARQKQLIVASDVGQAQRQLASETLELTEIISSSGLHQEIIIPDQPPMPGPLNECYKHTVSAEQLMKQPNQDRALAELIAALASLPDDPNQNSDESDDDQSDWDELDEKDSSSDAESGVYEDANPFGDFSDYEEIRSVPPPNKRDIDILQEEIRNQERRKGKKDGKYRPVEKDW